MIKLHQEILSNIDHEMVIDSRLMGGMSNYTYLAHKNNQKYVFRIPGEGGHNFVDYFIEQENLKLVKNLDLNTTTVYLQPDQGYKISEYVEGTMVDEHVDLNLVSATLKTLHSAKTRFNNDYDHFARLTKYEAIHQNKVAKYDELKLLFTKLYDTHLHQHLGVMCHNDAQIANMIITPDNKLYLLDWEFAGNNDPIYDIASFGNKDFNQAINLINNYFEQPTAEQMLRLYAWRMFQCLQWFNVASYKAEIGLSEKLGVDFNVISAMYINLAEQMHTDALKYLK